MKIDVLGKNGFVPTQAIKDYVEKKLQKLEHYFRETEQHLAEARVVCKVYNEYHKIEVTIPTKKYILRAEVSDKDMYAAIDHSIDKLITQFKRHKEKSNRYENTGRKAYVDDLNIEALEKEVIAKQLVRNKTIELKPMTQEEAISQMELLGHSFFVYLDISTNAINVIYIREDGNYAVIETK